MITNQRFNLLRIIRVTTQKSK
ncbi:hypothetical protein CY0110_15847 [Crocosphaera chwakensis CCY0110]|uniref:Uncharacterized protein n=1 Tax=Crocosphaera chwakensis CCY0110 TaxID=391612 RepID=A3IHK1_9CHRO|nr:hypothetical protein CY0110_15847 [Crocosphaera chwakensis CCY0110]